MKDIYSIKSGDRVKFIETKIFWFTDMIENGNKLEKGREYTVKNVDILSSFIKITLKETKEKEYCLSWFELI